MDTEASPSNSETSAKSIGPGEKLPAWMKVGAVAGASALAGGLAALWFYRKSLLGLQNVEIAPVDSNLRISAVDPQDDE
jgi:hypothetical protein